MKLINSIFLLFALSFSSVSYGVLTSSAVIEINAAGHANGACIFDGGVASPGTDRSQDTSYFKNNTDLASTSGTTNPCIVTSAGSPFTSSDNGNAIIVTAGANWTVQRAIIVSVDGSGNATLDRACGSSATLSSGTWGMGRACALGNSTSGISDDDLFEMPVSGNKVYVKKGSYSPSTVTINASPTAGLPVLMLGYNSSRDDNPSIASGNQPTLAMAANIFTFAADWRVRYITATGTGTSVLVLSGNRSHISDSKVTNSSGTAGRNAINASASAGFNATRNEAISTNGNAINCGTGNCYAVNNYAHDSATGILVAGTGNSNAVLTGNIISKVTTAGINISGANGMTSIRNNTIYCAATPAGSSAGLLYAAGTLGIDFTNNNVYGCITGVSGGGTANTLAIYSSFNNIYNCTTARTNFATGISDTAIDPGFKDPANGDFSVSYLLSGLGGPSAFPGGYSTNYVVPGAIQRRPSLPRGRK